MLFIGLVILLKIDMKLMRSKMIVTSSIPGQISVQSNYLVLNDSWLFLMSTDLIFLV